MCNNNELFYICCNLDAFNAAKPLIKLALLTVTNYYQIYSTVLKDVNLIQKQINKSITRLLLVGLLVFTPSLNLVKGNESAG